MIEIEVLVEVFDDFERARQALRTYEFCGTKQTIDTYYYDPLRRNLKPYSDGKLYASFRVRQRADGNYLTYKNDHYLNGLWQYSDEFEVPVGDETTIGNILDALGLKKLLVIDSEKHIYKFQDYEIVLETVKELGTFLEVELKRKCDQSQVSQVKNEIQHFIGSLGISVSPELNAGKPELFLQKNHICIKHEDVL